MTIVEILKTLNKLFPVSDGKNHHILYKDELVHIGIWLTTGDLYYYKIHEELLDELNIINYIIKETNNFLTKSMNEALNIHITNNNF